MLALPHSPVCALPVSLTLRSSCLTHSALAVSHSSLYTHRVSFLTLCSPCLTPHSMLALSHSSLYAHRVSLLTLCSPCLTPHPMLTVSHSSLYARRVSLSLYAHRVSLLKLCSPCLTPHTVLNLKLPASCSMVFFLPSTPPTAESLAVAFCQTCSPAPTGGSSVCHRVPQPRLVALQCVTVFLSPDWWPCSVSPCSPAPTRPTWPCSVSPCSPAPTGGHAVCHRVQHELSVQCYQHTVAVVLTEGS